MNTGYGSPAGNVTPGSVERSGRRSSRPAATLSAEPWTSSRTSYPRALYRVFETRARVPSSSVRTMADVSTSPASAKYAAPRLEPVA